MEEDYHTFREQLENKTIKEFTKSINENKLTFESSYATGIISFNDYHIIEMEVINKKNATLNSIFTSSTTTMPMHYHSIKNSKMRLFRRKRNIRLMSFFVAVEDLRQVTLRCY